MDDLPELDPRLGRLPQDALWQIVFVSVARLFLQELAVEGKSSELVERQFAREQIAETARMFDSSLKATRDSCDHE
jgi:hypothetical protein